MMSRTMNQLAQSPWARLVWAGIAVLALLQVVAFYRLCTGQVQRAHARETVALEQRNALTDCLDDLRRSTISSCARQVPGTQESDATSLATRDLPRAHIINASMTGSASPVSSVFH